MLLAQIAETTKVVSQVLDQSTEFGPMTYVLIVFLLVVACERAANFWWIVKPESVSRRETEKSVAASLNTFATNATATTALLQQMVDWQKKIDSGIRNISGGTYEPEDGHRHSLKEANV